MRPTKYFIGIALLLCAIAAVAQQSEKSDALTTANSYYDSGSYGVAADAYSKVPASMIDRDTRLRWARSLAWSSQLDAAERMYSQILRDNGTPDVELEYGRVLSWMGTSRAAVDTLQKVYAQNRSEDAALALANAMAWNGNREGAVALLDEFGSAKTKELADQMRSSPDIRIERVGKLIESEPYNLALQVEKARLLNDAGRYAESLGAIKSVREHAVHKIEGLDELEKAAKEGRQRELAKIDEQRKALDAQASMASSSQNADQILALAKAYTGVAEYRTAERLYDRYLDMRPDDFDARVQYARVLSWDRRYPQSEQQYEMLLAKQPDRADLRLEYAQIQSWNSEFAPAINTFRTLTDLSGNPRANLYPDVAPRAYYNLGQIYRWYGWNETAASQQNQALALDGSYVPARQELDLVRHVRPTSNADVRVSYATDSNDFTSKRADLTAEKWTSQRTAFDLSLGRHEFEQGNQDVYANVIGAGGRYRWSDRWTARANLGLNFWDSGLGTRPFFGVGAEWLPSIQSRAAFDFNHYDLVYDVFTLGSLGSPTGPTTVDLSSPLSINDFRGHYDYNERRILVRARRRVVRFHLRRQQAHRGARPAELPHPQGAVRGHQGRRALSVLRPPHEPLLVAHRLQARSRASSRSDRTSATASSGAWRRKRDASYEQGRSSDLRSYEGTITVPISDALDLVGNYGYGKSGRFDSISPLGSDSTDFTNYWQRHWYAGVRVKQLFGHGDRNGRNSYYYDTRPLAGASPVIPPLGETH